ncbi:ATPase, T2SS/T4P/T4SS family [Microbacterium sp. YY-01]|uniref:ATPase, T2SS/T4P/T4SS family n=1 Tax=Microbacterium sp. YY-01 TaxID=3421634 RepID=UPI003D18168B
MTQPSVLVAERVRERLRREHIDPTVSAQMTRRIAQAEVRHYNDHALSTGAPTVDDEHACVRDVLAAVSGFGALQPLLDDPTIEEVWLNGDGWVHVARSGQHERISLRLEASMIRDLVERMLQTTGRRVDFHQPFVDASLPDGSRLHVAIADVVRGGWSLNIRKFLPRLKTLDSLVEQGAMPAAVSDMLAQAMRAGRSVIVSGATHAGNTTWEI